MDASGLRRQAPQREFRGALSDQVVGGLDDDALVGNPLEWLDEKFSSYVVDRRREPRGDVLTKLAEAKYPDGSTPEVIDVVRLATFLFAAGQETTTKLLTAAMRVLGERPDLQTFLCEERDEIPAFLEEIATDGKPGQEPLPPGARVHNGR